jgi:hypothetical protein
LEFRWFAVPDASLSNCNAIDSRPR